MSDKDTVAFNLLLNSLINTHNVNREKNSNGTFEGDFVDYTDEEIKQFALTLWGERYQDDLTKFKSEISSTILEKSKKL